MTPSSRLPAKTYRATVAGVTYEGRDEVIRSHGRIGRKVTLVREPDNSFDKNAIRVLLHVPVLFGLLGWRPTLIGYIRAGTAKWLARRLDRGESVRAHVHSTWMTRPRVTIEFELMQREMPSGAGSAKD
ncbi:MAG: HIRAN domain-containing protein [Phycisphaerae bacterium]|nr:HIRAN domain-containing protein [Phycisphaerae bacterium]